MANGREIAFSAKCDAAADRMGGYIRIDESLIPIFDALYHDPTGFPRVDVDWCACRFIVTKPFRDVPALLWLFYIEPSGRVVIDHVEEFEGY